eukprot:1160453-Pelagomonas_calceolata.AAC.8
MQPIGSSRRVQHSTQDSQQTKIAKLQDWKGAVGPLGAFGLNVGKQPGAEPVTHKFCMACLSWPAVPMLPWPALAAYGGACPCHPHEAQSNPSKQGP